MRNTTKKLFASVCTMALVANGVMGVMAQDKKQDRSSTSAERRTFVFQQEGMTIGVASDASQEPGIRIADPTGDVFRTAEGFPGFGVSSGGQSRDDAVFQFFTQEMSFDARTVTGVPFSAEIVTESVQTLSDGNRIVQRTEGRMYRDSQGRTRSEKTFKMGGSNTERQTIAISDPVNSVNLTLDPETRTARKVSTSRIIAPPLTTLVESRAGMPPGTSEVPKKVSVSGGVLQGTAIKRIQPSYPPIAKAAQAKGPVEVQIMVDEAGSVIETTVVNGHPLLRDAAEQAAKQWQFKPTELSGKPVKVQGILTFNFTLSDENPTSPGISIIASPSQPRIKAISNDEDLGKRMIEGVECQGTRTVTTLPAGAIGNENPIQTVRERWYSPELKMTILTRQNDPRFGESNYRVTNLVRAEPDATLFVVPNDYTVKESRSYSYRTSQDGSGKTILDGQIETKKRKPEEQ